MALKGSYPERIKSVRRGLIADALLITDLKNIRYLTGFTGSNAYLLLTARKLYFLTDSRYTEQAAGEVKGASVKTMKKCFYDELQALLRRISIKTLAFESANVTHREWSLLKGALKGIRLKPHVGTVETPRMVKDAGELALMREALRIAEKGFLAARRWIRPGSTELHVADMMEGAIKRAGADGLAFDIIVASGQRSSLPHAKPTEKKIKRGELVVVDMGTLHSGYHSDETRTFSVGRPGRERQKIYDTVLKAHDLAIEAARPGIKASEVDQAARGHIEEAGYGKFFGHGTGHGVGLDIHEGPTIGPKSDTVLKEGMVFTIEPGVYVPGLGGVRIEDMVLVTKTGSELLSRGAGELESLV